MNPDPKFRSGLLFRIGVNAALEIAQRDVREVMSRRRACATGLARRYEGRVRRWMGVFLTARLVCRACGE